MSKKALLSLISLIVLTLMLAACGGEAEIVEVTKVVKETVVEKKTIVETVVETVVEKETVVETVIVESHAEPEPTAEPAVAARATATAAPTPTPFSASFEVVGGDEGGEAIASAPDTADMIKEEKEPDEIQQPVEPLTAGEIDDNELFQKYLDYVENYYGPPVYAVDVSERHIISIRDAKGLPVLDAHVTAFANGQLVFEGRTTASGQVLVHPRALELNAGTTIAVRVEKNGAVDELSFVSGQSNHHVVKLNHSGRADAPVALDVLFLIDATGSMDDEINKLKASILQISAQIDALPSRPDVRFGMVTYRDRGDAYVTRVHDFTPDVHTFQTELERVRARGGGDYPESLNEALHHALWEVEWREGEAVRLIFLVADAPPHLDYEQDFSYDNEMVEAVRRGIKIVSIASSGLDDQGEYIFRQLAQFTLGRFVFLTYEEAGQPSSGPGEETSHHVEPQDYTVDVLDHLIVHLVTDELATLSDPAIRYWEQ
ncbi:MAG: vWA domain-containing protein [Anaerolineae bacterium]|jgi:Mg-chelatase subunit ChlD